MDQISVILPCYNVAPYLDRCLTSLTTQTIGVERLQILCVDDASTDDTREKLREWEQRFPENLCIIECSENRRQGTARNIGLQYAAGKYVSFVDPDDWVEPSAFEVLLQVMEAERPQMVQCGFVRDFGDGKPDVNVGKNASYKKMDINSGEKRSHKIALTGSEPMVWGRLLEREYLVREGLVFPEDLAYEDNYWCLLLSGTIEKYCVLEAPLYHYCVNGSSTILKNNAEYHTDFLTVQLLALEEAERRGWVNLYPDAMEFHFLHGAYLDFLKIICLRYDNPPYALFRLVQEIVGSRMMVRRDNPYYADGFTEFQKLLLGLIECNVTKEQFREVAVKVKSLGI
ncbi:MAG: glycosyltransferase [Lachnospiraceae bacterium]|nr:glycosyltransferase [Lachnospiraceae bacterium]